MTFAKQKQNQKRRQFTKPWGGLWVVFLSFLSACQSPQKVETKPHIPEFTVETSTAIDGALGCKHMLDNYCTSLYSPEASGNIQINHHKPIQILQGETQNQLSQVYVKYAQAKIKNRHKLPADFLDRLNQYFYFEKLDDLIHRTPVPKMSLNERLNSEHLEYELSSLWQTAIDQSVVSRMSRKYHGFHQIPERAMPIEYEIEQKRVRRTLISEISRVLWREDANWKKVEDGFRDLKTSFISLIERLDVTEDVRSEWKEKIASVQLVLPGSLPEISDEECSKTTINAYYYKNLNLITVCAGDFNSEDIILTLAHEMSHALGIDRGLSQFLLASKVGEKMGRLREGICESREPMTCTEWADFKAWLPQGLSEMRSYQPELPEFNRCLKKTPTSHVLSEADSARFAKSIVNSRVSNLAAGNVFLRLIEKNLPLRNGKMQSNPNYMNPCGYYLWSKKEEPLDHELYTLMFFTAEYQCSQGEKNDRLKHSIETAQALSTQLIKEVISREGEFSERPELVNEGFASSPSERFADVVGTYAVAEFLQNSQKFTSSAERRDRYLASTSWLCQEPSLETNYPEESKIEQQFSQESHSQGEDRKMEILPGPIRKVLQCEKDFVFNECELSFRK